MHFSYSDTDRPDQSVQTSVDHRQDRTKKLELPLPRHDNQEEWAVLKAELAKASSQVQAEKLVSSDLREELRSSNEARVALEARMRQADKFEMMYLDVVDREAKIQLLLAEAEERTQVLEERDIFLSSKKFLMF